MADTQNPQEELNDENLEGTLTTQPSPSAETEETLKSPGEIEQNTEVLNAEEELQLSESLEANIKHVPKETKEVEKDNEESEETIEEYKELVDENEEEEEIEEEYEEEEADENGDIKTVKKKKIVKVLKQVRSKSEVKGSFIEKQLEYEEEEVDESGEKTIVKKTRIVRVPREPFVEAEEDFEEVEHEYEEEELDEQGETIIVVKKRKVKVPKQPQETGLLEKEGEEVEKVIGELIEEQEVKEVEKDAVEKESTTEEQEIPGEEIETVSKDREEQGEVEEEKKEEGEKEEEEKDGEEEEKEGHTLKQELKEQDEVALSISSAELKLAEERSAIAEQYEVLTTLRNEHIMLKKKSLLLTNKLCQYFKKQKMDHVFTETKEDPDMEQLYTKKLMLFYESNQQTTDELQQINMAWENQRATNEELAAMAKQESEELLAQKKEMAAKLIDPKTGRTIQFDKVIEDLMTRQEDQLRQLSECRLVQIKLKHKIESKKEERKMDHMGMDFNLMDYEKLSSLKEYYMDKITERDVEIGEVSQKLAIMEDKLKNVREVLRKKEDEMYVEQLRLQRISADLNKKRANLNNVKATRHRTEKNTSKIRQQSGLLAYPNLLKDYEEKSQQLKELTNQTDNLKQTYRVGLNNIRKMRENITKKTQMKYSIHSSSTYGTYFS